MDRYLICRAYAAALLFPAAQLVGQPRQARPATDGAPAAATQTIAQRTAALQKMDGFMPIYFDTKTAHLFIEISGWNKPFLYLRHTATGNGGGVNRGSVGQPLVVHFSRIGPKILLTN